MLDLAHVSSLDDPRVNDFRNVRDVDLRGGGGFAARGSQNKLFMIESAPVIERFFRTEWRRLVKSVLVSERRVDDLRPILEAKLPSTTPVMVASDALVKEISGYRHHSGALAAAFRPSSGELAASHVIDINRAHIRRCLIGCEGITHVDNIGAIFRNVAAFGADGVLLDKACADPLFRKAIRVSMGHVFSVRWGSSDDWLSDIDRVRDECGMNVIGVESHAGGIALPRLRQADRMMLLFGSERQGLTRESLARCDDVIEIPMSGDVPSVNVATAVAIALYEYRRNASRR